jgi:hypothetical protein
MTGQAIAALQVGIQPRFDQAIDSTLGQVVSLGLVRAALAAVGVGLVAGVLIATRFLDSLDVPVDVSSATEPASLLRRARWSYLLDRLAVAASVATVWLWAGTTFAIAEAIPIGAGFVIVIVAGSGVAGAWPRFHEARIRLALRRRLPWRTMAFLADAHQRGVLRQVGAAYQFRHIRLQQELAGGYLAWPPVVAPFVARAGDYLRVFRDFPAIRVAQVQDVLVSDDTVSGVVDQRTPHDALREQLAADAVPVMVMAAVAVILALADGELPGTPPPLPGGTRRGTANVVACGARRTCFHYP